MADMLATPQQLALLMRDTGLDEDLATLLLELATGEVQAMARQRLILVEDDPFEIEVYGPATVFELPERPVSAVSQVTIDGLAVDEGTDAGEWRRASGAYRLHRDCGWGCRWPSFVAGVYTHGYTLPVQGSPDTGLELGDPGLVPAQNAVLGLARLTASNASGVLSESIDDYRVQFANSLAEIVAASDNLRASLQRTYGIRAGGVRVLR